MSLYTYIIWDSPPPPPPPPPGPEGGGGGGGPPWPLQGTRASLNPPSPPSTSPPKCLHELDRPRHPVLFSSFQDDDLQTLTATKNSHLYCRNKSDEVIKHLQNEDIDGIREDFDSIDWTPEALGDLESSVRSGNLTNLCIINIVVAAFKLS